MSLLRSKLECLLRTITITVTMIHMVTSTMATTTSTTNAMMIVVIGICGSVESEGGMVTIVMVFVALVVGSRDTREDTAEHNMCDITPNTEREQLELAHLDQCLH